MKKGGNLSNTVKVTNLKYLDISWFFVKLKKDGNSNLGLRVALWQQWVKDSPIAGLGAVPLFLNLGLWSPIAISLSVGHHLSGIYYAQSCSNFTHILLLGIE